MKEAYDKWGELTGREESETTEYVEKLKHIEERVEQIRSWLESFHAANYQQIESALAQASHELAVSKEPAP